MGNIWTKTNKILAAVCVLAALFCGGMAARYMLLPRDGYEARLQEAQTRLQEAQAALAARLGSADEAMQEADGRQAQLLTQRDQLKTANEEKKAACEAALAQQEALTHLPETILKTREEYGNQVRLLEEMIMAGQTDVRICYLTFDDGPNNLTQRILEKMEALDVYATFFTIGANSAPEQAENLRREMMGGHTVANHTYSHDIFGTLYDSLDEFTYQVTEQDEKVYQATGFHTDLVRFPSGSVMCPFLEDAEAWLEENGYAWIDWNASAWDSGFHSFDVGGAAISSNIYATTEDLDIAVVLCHDFNYSTYQGMDQFVPKLREMGFVFLPLFPQSHMLDEPLNVV